MYKKPIISSLGLEESIVLRKPSKTHAKLEDTVYAYEVISAVCLVVLVTIDPAADMTIFIVVA